MCEILLCVKDRGKSGVLAIDSRAPKQGDVVMVVPDGWPWSDAERGIAIPGNPNGNHNFMRIIQLPNVSVALASSMLAPEADIDPLNPSPYLQFRAFFLDKTKISNQALLNNLADDLRANPSITLNFTAAQLNTIVTQRIPIAF